MEKILRLGLGLLASAALVACGPPSTYKVHHTLQEAPEARVPKRIVVLAPDIEVREYMIGGVTEKVDDWGRQAAANVAKSLRKDLGARPGVKVVDLPALAKDDQQRVDQHRALYDQVANVAFRHTMGDAGQNTNIWRHKQERFDYTLGPGLRFLKAKTGADAAVIAVGSDVVSSKGRKTARAVTNVLSVVTLGIVSRTQLGYSYLSLGFVDLNTGDVLWFDYEFYGDGSRDMREPDDVDDIVKSILANYPGVEIKNRKVAQR